MPEPIPVPPPNDPRHLPPPSQLVSLASATVHPRLAISSIVRSNFLIFRLAAIFFPEPATLQTSHPYSVSAFFIEPSDYQPRSDPFHHNRTTLPRPPVQRSTSVPATSIATEAHLPNTPCRSPPQCVTTLPPFCGLRRPSGGSSCQPPHGLVSFQFFNRWTPYRPLFTATLALAVPPIQGHQRYIPTNFSVYPPACPGYLNHNKPTVHCSRPTSLATPINHILATYGPSAFLDDNTTDDPD